MHSARGKFPTAKPAYATSGPVPTSITDPEHAWLSWEVGSRGTGRASEVQSAEKPMEGVTWHQKSLLTVWVVCSLEELMDFGCFWRMFWFGRFLEKEAGLIPAWSPSTSRWLLRLRWFPGVWTKATSQGDCMHAACDNIICTVPGTGAATHPSSNGVPRPCVPDTSLQCPLHIPPTGHQPAKP